MAETTKIQWTDHTFSPWRGCSHVHAGCDNCYVSPWRGCSHVHAGCDNCYAEALAKRNPAVLGVWGDQGTRVVASEAQWKLPEKWNRQAAKDGVRRRVFCASLADVFEDWQGQILMSDGTYANNAGFRIRGQEATDRFCGVPLRGGTSATTMSDVRHRLFRLIDACPHLDWLLLTKRPENVRRMWPEKQPTGNLDPIASAPYGSAIRKHRKNVWLLTSVSDQQTADAAIPELLKCRDLCPVLGISAEPLLGPIYFEKWTKCRCGEPEFDYGHCDLCLRGGIDWIIVGGESGPGARTCNVEWVLSIVEQCNAAGVPCFVKQLGSHVIIRESTPAEYMAATHAEMEWPEGTRFRGTRVLLRDPKGGDPTEWPEDLRVREVPDVLR